MCIKGVTVTYKKDDNSEALSVFNDDSMVFNGSPVSAVSNTQPFLHDAIMPFN